MSIRVESNAEPLPGYRLIERLGGGGFGEVWKAEAPGGLFKAIKFVYGDLQCAGGEDDNRAEQELKGLSRVKTVHHPYILSLERYDIIDGQLLIVMELADQTLWDRFKECRGQGLGGIPHAELVPYMEETGEALDLMNIQFQLQHLDIKPQNLFLVYNHIKVADFGLVKDLEGMTGATVTGGITPVYAAPETFDGRISRFSDQYSLAIVYQELLTGIRPFSGSTVRQLVLQHLQGSPDLSSLPTKERPVVLRALSKDPDKRFPTCREFIEALRSVDKSSASVARLPASRPSDPDKTEKPANAPKPVEEDSLQVTHGIRGRAKGTESAGMSYAELDVNPTPTLGSRQISAVFSQKATVASSGRQADNEEHPGVLQPAFVIGLGQLGIDTLRHLREQLSDEFGHIDALPHLRMTAIDVDVEAVRDAVQGKASSALRPHEVLHAALHRPSHYIKAREKEGKASFDDWLNSKMLYRIPRQQSQAGARSLGRLAFVDHYRAIFRRLDSELQACCSDDTVHELSQNSELGLRTRVPRVYVVSCLAGTTGSGMFLDVAYVMRDLLRRHGFNGAEVVGILYLPPANRDLVSPLVLANTYAALKELRYFASGENMFRAQYEKSSAKSPKVFTEAGPPFQRCYLLKMPERRPGMLISHQNASEMVSQASQFLFRELVTKLGKTADEKRKPHQIELGTSFHSFGVQCLKWPRRHILDITARRLCKRLVDRWMNKKAGSISEEIQIWTEEQWEGNHLDSENLVRRQKELCEKTLKQEPETIINNILKALPKTLDDDVQADGRPRPLNIGPALTAMEDLEKYLGIPDEARGPHTQSQDPGTVERALAECSSMLGDECERKLAILVVRLIEEPRYRLAGAEEALRQFGSIVEKKLRAHEQLVRELNQHSARLYQKILDIIEHPEQAAAPAVTNSVWKVSFSRRSQPGRSTSPGQELLELLRSYPKARYQSLVLNNLTKLYVSLRGQLSDQVREVGFCRHRLSELSDLLEGNKESEAPSAESKPSSASRSEKSLLPPGCVDLEDAIQLLEGQVTAEDLVAFDEKVQALLRQQFQALVHVCMGPSNVVRSLVPIMINLAKAFLEPLLEGDNIANMFLAKHGSSVGGEIGLRKELTEIFDKAKPEVSINPDCQDCIIALPDCEASEHLNTAISEVLPRAFVQKSDRVDEILCFREESQIMLEDLEQFGPVAEEAYQSRQANLSLHSREDIPEWHNGASIPN